MDFDFLEKELNALNKNLEALGLINFEHVKSEAFLHEFNKSSYLLTLHDVQRFKPICINNAMKDFYGFKNNWLFNLDHLFYLKTIHTSTYHSILESISFFRHNENDFLNLQ